MKHLYEAVSEVRILDAQTASNLVMFPLVKPGRSYVAYLTLADAVAAGLASVREKSLAGSVPEILLENRAEKPILILDGEELVGAKQNRTVNITILAPANATTSIPVTCIEAGRWSSGPMDFDVAARMHYSRGRAMKMENVSMSLAMSESREADQSEVWDQIARKSERMQVRSATSALSDVFDSHQATTDDYLKKLRIEAGQTGAIFAIDGKVEGLELFDSPETFSKMFQGLVRSYALDAIETAREPSATSDAPDAHNFLQTVIGADLKSYPAVGIGQEIRINTESLVAGGLLVDETLIHLCAFVKRSTDAYRPQDRHEFSRPSLRRHHWRSRR